MTGAEAPAGAATAAGPGTDPAAGTLAAARRLMWVLVVPVLVLLAVLSTLQYQARITDAERELLRRADERAQELEALARPAIAHVHDLRRLLEARWDDPPDSGPALREAMAPRRPGGAQGAVDGWTMDAAPEAARQRFGQVWWAPADGREPDAAWLRRARHFVEAARIVHQRAPGFVATWFAAAEDNTSFGYPWVSTEPMLRAMGVPSLQALDARRRSAAERTVRELAADPNDTTFWGSPAVSQLDGELVMSHGAVVLVGGRYRGEVSVDFRLDDLQRAARRWQEASTGTHGVRVWVVDRQLHVLADASQPLVAPEGQGLADTRVLVPLATRLPEGMDPAALDATLFSAERVQRVAGRGGWWNDGWVVAAAVRIGSPWVYVQATPEAALRAQVIPTLLPNLLLALALLAIFVAGQWLVDRWFVSPALRVLAYLRELSTRPDAAPPQLGPRWRGWVDAVTQVFVQRREAALQIERQRDALRQTEKLSAMGTLLAGVAHELNNPLAIVMGRASLLEEKTADPALTNAPGAAGVVAGQIGADARRIREAAERCGRIVRTFLNMARHKPAERSPVQLNDIVRAAADMLGYTLRSHDIALELQLAPALPEALADGDQIGQVVLNLVVNAQQALAAATGVRRIVVTTGVEPPRPDRDSRIWLRVADTGPGVPEAERERIFEPFFTTKAAGLGTGLGLSVSRSIVREHGGDLVLEVPRGVAPTGGASFRLSLPIGGAPAGVPGADVALPSAAAGADTPARILVVDDEPEIADLVRAVLEGAGFEVVTAESGAVALEMLAEARFDAVVSDVRMPDMDGALLWRELSRRWPALAPRVLFVTGDTLSAQARNLLDESGCASLDKPFAKADLLAAVRALLSRR
jgi:signal transduction histidine kinase/CheY-like chemotaxis protein